MPTQLHTHGTSGICAACGVEASGLPRKKKKAQKTRPGDVAQSKCKSVTHFQLWQTNILRATPNCLPNQIWQWFKEGQLTWLALGDDQAARSRRVEKLIALRVLQSPRRLRWGRSTAKFLVALARVRAAGNITFSPHTRKNDPCRRTMPAANPHSTDLPCGASGVGVVGMPFCWAGALEKLRE